MTQIQPLNFHPNYVYSYWMPRASQTQRKKLLKKLLGNMPSKLSSSKKTIDQKRVLESVISTQPTNLQMNPIDALASLASSVKMFPFQGNASPQFKCNSMALYRNWKPTTGQCVQTTQRIHVWTNISASGRQVRRRFQLRPHISG